MERVKSRSESPFSNSKSKNHSSDASENGNRINEQAKTKKKNLRSKNKHQSNGKEIEDSSSNEQDNMEEEQAESNENDNKGDSNNIENGKETNGTNYTDNGSRYNQENEINGNDNDTSVVIPEISKEISDAGADSEINEVGVEEQSESIEGDINTEEINSEECTKKTKIETESCAKKDILLPECKVVIEAFDEKYNQGTNNTVKTETNGVTPEEEPNDENLTVEEIPQNGLNNSDGSLSYEKADITQEQIEAFPDTVKKDDSSLPNKITNFFGKLTYSLEQKQDSEITSSKIIENTNAYHPYLSKVSGRRGIKDRLNSSATVFSSAENIPKTPENLGVSLDDSFRVRTNPPCLHSVDLDVNPTLRKFKGKRCLNADEEPDKGGNAYLSTIKRRKLDEKTQESGILGSILWSPFKKRSLENENQLKLTTTESKLSRLLSPFWFWKKATEGKKKK